jgi:uncharacterized protein (DUF2235 family)
MFFKDSCYIHSAMKLLPYFCFVLLMQSCTIRTIPKNHISDETPYPRHILAVYMDGTNNKSQEDIMRNTHVKTMHGLTEASIRSVYIEGVGTRGKVIGSLLGTGTKVRVTKAYRFLSQHYNTNDSVCLFGFSRGANQCRILSNLIYTAGIIDLDKVKTTAAKKRIIRNVYAKYHGRHTSGERRKKIAQYLDSWNEGHPGQQVDYDTTGSMSIELMGLFETVEALDIFDRKEITSPRKDHLDQVMNVKKIIHAVALDDNRAWTYTPVLIATKDVAVNADTDAKGMIEEVWFSGSHRDVGGGNRKDPWLQTISLNWMVNKLKPYKLFRDSMIFGYTYAQPHNMNGTIWLRMPFADNNRSINDYYSRMRTTYGKLRVHRSVLDRLAAGVIPDFKTTRGRTDWFDLPPFDKCFEKKGRARILRPGCDCIEVVD